MKPSCRNDTNKGGQDTDYCGVSIAVSDIYINDCDVGRCIAMDLLPLMYVTAAAY